MKPAPDVLLGFYKADETTRNHIHMGMFNGEILGDVLRGAHFLDTSLQLPCGESAPTVLQGA